MNDVTKLWCKNMHQFIWGDKYSQKQ
jgi:hypothetical protein